jgi:hypothetical protein
VPDVYRGWNVDEYEPKPVTKDPEGLVSLRSRRVAGCQVNNKG